MASTTLPFAQVYESCLENISLVRIRADKNENLVQQSSASNLVTLGEVVRISRFILFYILRSSNHFCMDFLTAINNLMGLKNNQKNLTNR